MKKTLIATAVLMAAVSADAIANQLDVKDANGNVIGTVAVTVDQVNNAVGKSVEDLFDDQKATDQAQDQRISANGRELQAQKGAIDGVQQQATNLQNDMSTVQGQVGQAGTDILHLQQGMATIQANATTQAGQQFLVDDKQNSEIFDIKARAGVTTQAVQQHGSAIQAIQQQATNFVTKPDFDAGQKTQDDALTAAVTTQQGVDKVQDAKLTGLRQANSVQDAAIAANTKGVADNKQAAADATTLATQAVNGLADKVDQTAYDADKTAQQKKDSDQSIKIAGNASAIADLKQNVIPTLASEKQLDAEVFRAKAAEQKNADAVTAETTRATGAEQKLTQDKADKTYVDGQIAMRDKGIQGNTNNITQIKKDLGTTTATATAAAAAVAQETKDRVANDQALAARTTTNADAIKAEAARALSAEQTEHTALTAETTRATTEEQRLETVKADKTAVTAVQSGVDSNKKLIDTNTQGVADNKATATAAQTTATTNSGLIAQNKSAIATNTSHFTALQTAVSQKVDTGVFQQRAADLDSRIQQNKADLAKTNQTVANHTRELADHEARIKDLESNNQTNFNKLKEQQDKDRKEARAGIAGAIALTQVPGLSGDQSGNFGMAVGTYNGESAIAAGVTTRVSTNVSVKTGLSWDTQGNVGAGAGMAVGW